jgi:hypothetical protein
MPTFIRPASVQVDPGSGIPVGLIAAAVATGVAVALVIRYAAGIEQALAIATGAGLALAVAGTARAVQLLRRDRGVILAGRDRLRPPVAAPVRRQAIAPARPVLAIAPPSPVPSAAVLAAREAARLETLAWARAQRPPRTPAAQARELFEAAWSRTVPPPADAGTDRGRS